MIHQYRFRLPMTAGAWTLLARRFGLVGWLGLAMLLVAGWLHWSILPAQQDELARQASKARQARHALLDAAAMQAALPASAPDRIALPDEAWQALLAGLPDQNLRIGMQAELLAAAKDSGLSVQSIKWRGAPEAWSTATPLWRQRMQIPVEGPYLAVRRWTDQLLAQKALSLDAIDIQRGDVMSDRVKAQVTLSLWWRMAARKGAE